MTACSLAFGPADAGFVRDLNFRIGPGLTVVRGGDGRGKTSLLRTLAGELPPLAGTLECGAATRILASPMDATLDAVTGREWLGSLQLRFGAWRADRSPALIEAFALAPHLDKSMHMLSTGTRRKLGLVAATLSGAELTLIDMPFAALDLASVQCMTHELRAATEDTHRAWVIADHEVPAGLDLRQLAAVIDLGD